MISFMYNFHHVKEFKKVEIETMKNYLILSFDQCFIMLIDCSKFKVYTIHGQYWNIEAGIRLGSKFAI